VERQKETIVVETTDRNQKKKLERQEEKLKNSNRDLAMVRVSSYAIDY
jgi:hypothetical protein